MARHQAAVNECVAKGELPPALDEDYPEKALAVLGYPGFAYLTRYIKFETQRERTPNPTELIQWAIAENVLNTRIMEALPWLLAAYVSRIDWKSLIDNAQKQGVQNWLGYLVCLALKLVESKPSLSHPEAQRLLKKSSLQFQEIRHTREQTLMNEEIGPVMRTWVQANRPQEAAEWHILTTIAMDDLQHAE